MRLNRVLQIFNVIFISTVYLTQSNFLIRSVDLFRRNLFVFSVIREEKLRKNTFSVSYFIKVMINKQKHHYTKAVLKMLVYGNATQTLTVGT